MDPVVVALAFAAIFVVELPDKTFIAANDRAQCAYMKVTTLPKVRDALLYDQHRITVPDDIAARARLSIERMVAIGNPGSGE